MVAPFHAADNQGVQGLEVQEQFEVLGREVGASDITELTIIDVDVEIECLQSVWQGLADLFEDGELALPAGDIIK